jgi:endoglucanase
MDLRFTKYNLRFSVFGADRLLPTAYRLLLFLLLPSSSIIGQSVFDERFHVDQIGYRPADIKICVISSPQTGYNAPNNYTPGSTIELRRSSDDALVFSASPLIWNNGNTHLQSGDKAWWFEFTSFNTTGDYYVNDPSTNLRSSAFRIAPDVYNDALKHTVRALYYQRCGVSKPAMYAGTNYADNLCHCGSLQDLNCRDVTQPNNSGTERDLSGGWHDAGDYNKYTNFTLAAVHYLLDAYEQDPNVFKDNYGIPESANGIPDVLDEVKFELDWLIKMQNVNGSVLMKVSTAGFNSASPPSADGFQRMYGTEASSATRTVASLFAHASIVFNSTGIPSLQTYGATLLAKAQLAWTWLQNNPGFSNYANTGFSSANPELSNYAQSSTSLTAAIYLYAATGNTVYRTYVDNNYMSIQPLQWTYWYPFESVYQDALLYYCNTPGATTSVVNTIRQNCTTSVSSNNADLLTAYNGQIDPYRAYMKTQDYVWNNNQFKAETGSLFYNMVEYNLDAPNQTNYKNAAEDFIHYFHGVNAVGYCFLSNSSVFGADNPVKEIYHGWFGDATVWDGNAVPYIGPPPGYLTCGVNYYYTPDGAYTGPPIQPPMNQPVQKCYKDWNTSWPENSWEVTEVGIYTQAAYIKLLSKFADTSSILTNVSTVYQTNQVAIYPNPNNGTLYFSRMLSEDAELILRDMMGKVIFHKFGRDEVSHVGELPCGLYLCEVWEKCNRVTNTRIWICH